MTAEHLEPGNPNLPSVEVVGNFSPFQREEFGFLAGQILEAQSGRMENREDVDKAARVAYDCIQRGLRVLGRTWFTRPDESIADAFGTGLSAREEMVNRLGDLYGLRAHRLLSSDEESALRGVINGLNPLSPGLEEAEDILDITDERSRQVARFHQALFTDSSLAPQAKLLERAALDRSAASRERLRHDDLMDGVYRNLLINVTLYPGSQPDLLIEPQDIAAVVDLWRVPTAREAGSRRLIEGMQALARRFGIDEKAIAIYTDRMLDPMELMVYQGVDADSLKESTTFILTDESLKRRTVATPEMVIPVEVISQAESKLTKLVALQQQIERESARSERPFNEIVDIEASLSTPELLYLLQAIAQNDPRIGIDLQREVRGELPPEAYIEVLQLANKKIKGFDEKALAEVRRVAEEKILRDIDMGRVSLDRPFSDLPAAFLSRIIQRANLTEDQQQALLKQDVFFWVSVCQDLGVTFQAFLGENELSLINLFFPEEAVKLQNYVRQMPEDKQVEIIKGIRQLITF